MVELILNEAMKRNAEKIDKVHLEIGEFTFLAEEQMRFAFEVLTKGTIAENAEIEIRLTEGTIECDCGFQGKPKEPEDKHMLAPLLQCPECGKIANVKEGIGCTVRDISLVIPDVPA